MKLAARLRWLAVLAVVTVGTTAMAEDTLKLAIGQRGNWENAAPELGQEAGIFKKHGLVMELLYTQGAGETLQAVISGSVDIGIGVGTAGVLGAFAKGAPVRAIANSTRCAGVSQPDRPVDDRQRSRRGEAARRGRSFRAGLWRDARLDVFGSRRAQSLCGVGWYFRDPRQGRSRPVLSEGESAPRAALGNRRSDGGCRQPEVSACAADEAAAGRIIQVLRAGQEVAVRA